MDLEIFVGRFHPLIVHFPIALLVAASTMELLSRIARFRNLSSGLPFVLVLGTATAAVSVLLGFFISNDRGYDDDTLSWHKWTGISIVILSLFLTLVVLQVLKVSASVRTFSFVGLLILISAVGHLGGTLTHGENYLVEKAPAFLRNLFADKEPSNIFSKLPEDPDSVMVFKDVIAPLLIEKCTPCHNQTQKKGNLVLTSREGIEAGGDGGSIFRAGKAMESELFRRITLPEDHEKFMPLKERPLSYAEIKLIEWWINQGASFEGRLSEFSTLEIRDLLIRDYAFNPVSRPYYETVQVPAADSLEVDKLRKAGFVISQLAQDNQFLSISVANGVKKVSPDLLRELVVISDNITWIDLGGKQITDDHLPILAELGSLTRLNLSNNPITGQTLSSLSNLRYLESLNLFNTQVGDQQLKSLNELRSLKRVFLWNTNVTTSAIDELKKLRPRLEVDMGAPEVAVPSPD